MGRPVTSTLSSPLWCASDCLLSHLVTLMAPTTNVFLLQNQVAILSFLHSQTQWGAINALEVTIFETITPHYIYPTEKKMTHTKVIPLQWQTEFQEVFPGLILFGALSGAQYGKTWVFPIEKPSIRLLETPK